MAKWSWWHFIWVIALGYALGYWFPGLGNATIARIKPRG